LMTRANLLELARRFSAFEDIDEMTPDEIVSSMRKATRISSRAGRDQATLMTVSFEARRARIAADMVNEYVTLILSDNVTIRTDRAQETLEFFQQEVDRFSNEVSAQSARILEFQNTNADALPDTLNFRMAQQAALQERLVSAEATISSLEDQKQRLVQLYQVTGSVENAPAANTRSPQAQQLDALKEELNAALAIYAPSNPRVKILQAQVDRLQAEVDAQVTDLVEAPAENPDLTVLDIQVAEIDSRITLQKQQSQQLEEDIEKLSDSIARTSANTIALERLQRDYENVQQQYNIAIDRLAKASTGERIEVLAKGERISILDAAAIPSAPSSPDRMKIAAAGMAAGLGLGGGLVVLMEMLNKAVRRPTDLVRALEISPIGAIPFVRTPAESLRRRIVLALLLLIVLAGLPAGLWAAHTYYLPMDLLLEKIAGKLGL